MAVEAGNRLQHQCRPPRRPRACGRQARLAAGAATAAGASAVVAAKASQSGSATSAPTRCKRGVVSASSPRPCRRSPMRVQRQRCRHGARAPQRRWAVEHVQRRLQSGPARQARDQRLQAFRELPAAEAPIALASQHPRARANVRASVLPRGHRQAGRPQFDGLGIAGSESWRGDKAVRGHRRSEAGRQPAGHPCRVQRVQQGLRLFRAPGSTCRCVAAAAARGLRGEQAERVAVVAQDAGAHGESGKLKPNSRNIGLYWCVRRGRGPVPCRAPARGSVPCARTATPWRPTAYRPRCDLPVREHRQQAGGQQRRREQHHDPPRHRVRGG